MAAQIKDGREVPVDIFQAVAKTKAYFRFQKIEIAEIMRHPVPVTADLLSVEHLMFSHWPILPLRYRCSNQAANLIP